MSDTTAQDPSLLPAPLRRPLWLLGTLVVPQVILLLLNLHDWWLVAGEMTPTQADEAALLGAAGTSLWLAGLAGAL